jgi:hypothetical protein
MSVYCNILDAVVARIVGLDLPSIGNNVVRRKVAKNRKNVLPTMPGVIVSPWQNKAATIGGTIGRDDIPYGVLVAVLSPGNQAEDNFIRQTNWDEAISSAFRWQPLSQVSSVYICEPVQDVVFDPGMWDKNVDASVLVFKFISRETRG